LHIIIAPLEIIHHRIKVRSFHNCMRGILCTYICVYTIMGLHTSRTEIEMNILPLRPLFHDSSRFKFSTHRSLVPTNIWADKFNGIYRGGDALKDTLRYATFSLVIQRRDLNLTSYDEGWILRNFGTRFYLTNWRKGNAIKLYFNCVKRKRDALMKDYRTNNMRLRC